MVNCAFCQDDGEYCAVCDEDTEEACHHSKCDREATHSVNDVTERRRELLCEKHAEQEKDWFGSEVEVSER